MFDKINEKVKLTKAEKKKKPTLPKKKVKKKKQKTLADFGWLKPKPRPGDS